MSKSVDDNSSLESFSIESPAPLYARVKQAIAQKIRSGAWLPNSKLPSESELLTLLGVSRMTIHRMAADGRLATIQTRAGRRRIASAALTAFLTGKEVSA